MLLQLVVVKKVLYVSIVLYCPSLLLLLSPSVVIAGHGMNEESIDPSAEWQSEIL